MENRVLPTICFVLGFALAFNAWADDTYQNCYGVANCYASDGGYGNHVYYTIDNGVMTIYAPQEDGSSISLPNYAFEKYTSNGWVSTFPEGVSEIKFSGNINAIQTTFTGSGAIGNVQKLDLTGISPSSFHTYPFAGLSGLQSIDLGDLWDQPLYDAEFQNLQSQVVIYCQEGGDKHSGKTCESLLTYFNKGTLQLYTTDNEGNKVLYDKNADGSITSNGQNYASIDALLSALNASSSSTTNGGENHEKKRIYTVEEASKLSKETGNTFKLRYK